MTSRLLFLLLLAAAATAASPPVSAQAAPDTATKPKSWYVERRSYGTHRETEPPRYVRPLSKTGYEALREIDWLDVGLDFRLRSEVRDNDFRRDRDVVDLPQLLRTRAYVGVREKLDPFRLYVEFEDARRVGSRFPRDDRDFNEFEFIQAMGELYFGHALGEGRPLRLQGGRFATEYVDRRLIARNEWRNTTNNFQGARVILGRQENDWQVDLIAAQPLERRLDDPDRPRRDQWLFAAIGDVRRWSRIVTLQPYYLGLVQDESRAQIRRSIHSAALRGYGIVGETGFDYDFDVVAQFGRNAAEVHRAIGVTAEVGYLWSVPWKPRASVMYGYGSGDRDPNDGRNQRFERYFGFARPWSNDDYFQWENVSAPKLRFEVEPTKNWRLDLGYNWYWLASATDRWNAAGLRDRTGSSGDFLGQEFDLRSRHRLHPLVDATLGYAFFAPGEFTQKTARGSSSNFFYLELSLRAL